MDEMLNEFIVDCSENLEEFENGILELESNPGSPEVLDSMFRMIHSIKGASGFMAFGNLENLTHKAENVLDLLRNDKGTIDKPLISTFLNVCDAMKNMFDTIQGTGSDGTDTHDELVQRLLAYEESFKTGAPVAEASPAPQAQNEETTSKQEQAPTEGDLDPLQIEMLKSLGMYDENEATAPTEEAAQVNDNLDPLQVEMLKSLGMYDENSSANEAPAPVEVKRPEPEKKAEKKPAAPVAKKESIRVDVDTLDKLVNLAGELVLVRNQLLELSKINESQAFDASFASLDMVTGEIQRSLMTTRMQPISIVWSKMPRIVRDLANQLNKDIKIDMVGENTELDKTIIEAIADPMTHIIRNCCDHGLETPEERKAAGKSPTGKIKLVAEHKGNWIHVDIIDDGKGISREVLKRKALEKGLHTEQELEEMDDKEVLNIIFHPGFSTKDSASNISGRGVGMDVIKSNITKINGNVEIFSTEGEGTQLKLRLPLTLAIVPAVIVQIDNARYAIPQNVVQEIALANKNDFEDISGHKFTRLRGQILPLVFASEFLEGKANAEAETNDDVYFIVVNADGYRYGLVIDKVMDIIEIVVKPIDSDSDFKYYAGATIMGDGKVALILDTVKIVELSKISKLNMEEIERDHNDLHDQHTSSSSSTDLTLAFKLRNNKNYLIPLSKTSRIEEICKSKIEERQLGTYVNFNGKVIRVIDLADLLGIPPNYEHDEATKDDSIKALYFEFNGQGIAIDVGTDHSLLNQKYDLQPSSGSEFVVGTAIIDDTMYEVLFLEDYLDRIVNESGASEASAATNPQEVIAAAQAQEDSSETKEQEQAVISFKINDLQFGVNLDSIKEIISADSVTKTPGSRKSVEGLINLRGEIMITRKLTEVLDIEVQANENKLEQNSSSIIIHNNTGKICLQIGQVDEILNLSNKDFHPTPENLPANILDYVKGVYNRDRVMLLLLDEEKLISEVVRNANV